jgi:hypothetical protein
MAWPGLINDVFFAPSAELMVTWCTEGGSDVEKFVFVLLIAIRLYVRQMQLRRIVDHVPSPAVEVM